MDANYNMSRMQMPVSNGEDDGQQQQHLHQLQSCPTNLNAMNTTNELDMLSAIVNFGSSMENVNNNPTNQMTTHQHEAETLGGLFEESPNLEVLTPQLSKVTENEQVAGKALEDQRQVENIGGEVNVLEKSSPNATKEPEASKAGETKATAADEPADDEDDEDEEEDEEEIEEEVEDIEDEEEAIIPDDGVAAVARQSDEDDADKTADEDEVEAEKSKLNKDVAAKDDGKDNAKEEGNDDSKADDEDEADEDAAEDAADKPESEQPTSSLRSSRRQEEEVDENQCRVCCSKEDLETIFKKMEQQTVADMLMTICPSVSIVFKDFLPQFICKVCLENVVKAIQLKNQCETTEKELRKKLSRHKNKIRRPAAGYVVIDAPLESDPSDDESNDEEFKVSDVASSSPSEDSGSSDDSSSKKKRTRGRKRRKSSVTTPTIKSKSRSLKSEYISSDEDADPIGNSKRKRAANSSPESYPCDECTQVFQSKKSLAQHRKVHSNNREPIACRVCGKTFKIKGAYRSHMEKHREEKSANKCPKCSREFTYNSDLKRHLAEDHNQSGILYGCPKCKRTFVSASRLESHKKPGRCPGSSRGNAKKSEYQAMAVGQDLFKTVAPTTTTYWSDSFSE